MKLPDNDNWPAYSCWPFIIIYIDNDGNIIGTKIEGKSVSLDISEPFTTVTNIRTFQTKLSDFWKGLS